MTSSHQPVAPVPPVYPMKRVCPVDPPSEYARFRDEQPLDPHPSLGRLRGVAGDPVPGRTADLVRPTLQHHAEPAGLSVRVREPRLDAQGREAQFRVHGSAQHTGLRRKLTGMFTVKKIAEMGPAIERIVKDLIDAMEASGPPTDLVAAFALPLPSLVIADLLGVPYEDHGVFQECARQRVDLTVSPEVSLAAGDRIFDYLDGLLRRIEADPGTGRRCSLAWRSNTSCRATSRTKMRSAWRACFSSPVTTRPRRRSGGNAGAAAESAAVAGTDRRRCPDPRCGGGDAALRHHSPPQRSARRDRDVEIGGQTIRAGEGVLASLPAANRDPAAFPDPDRFDVHRRAQHHVAFAFGPHQCLGQALARLELQIAFRGLLKRLPSLRLAVPEEQLDSSREHDLRVLALPVAW